MSRNVLITAASRRVPLVRAFQRALARTRGGGQVIVTDVNPMSPAVHVADRAYDVQLSTAPGYIDEILAIALDHNVGLIVPTIDDELARFGDALPLFQAAGISVAVSDPDVSRLCDDKYATCRTLAKHGIAAARTWLARDLPARPDFPLFIKPRSGRGGVAAHAIRNARELAFFIDYVADPVVQEFLDGPEFTIDMLCDFTGRPLSVVPRRRDVIRAGVIDRGCTVKDQRLIDLAVACADVLPFAGAVNIQCRLVGNRPIVFEINPRFSGGIPLTIEAGADFPQLLLDLAAGKPVAPAIGAFRDAVWMTSYEASIFVEGDEIGLPVHRPRASGTQSIVEAVA